MQNTNLWQALDTIKKQQIYFRFGFLSTLSNFKRLLAIAVQQPHIKMMFMRRELIVVLPAQVCRITSEQSVAEELYGIRGNIQNLEHSEPELLFSFTSLYLLCSSASVLLHLTPAVTRKDSGRILLKLTFQSYWLLCKLS